jgi:diguanylate cyclase (GGDEF)-like protein/PAS domain S-box-containing protein
MNIRRRFIVFSIILGIVPVIISTSICIAKFNAKNMELIQDNVIASAHDQAMHLEYFFDQNISDLKITSSIPIVKEVLIDSNNKENYPNRQNTIEEINDILSIRKNQQLYLNAGLLVNNDGVVIAASNKDYIGKKGILLNEDMEKLSNNKVVVTNIREKEERNDSTKSVIVANPIFFEEKYKGAILNVINMSYFENIVNDVSFFQDGKIVIMDANGVVASSNSENLTDSINKIITTNNLYEQWRKINFNSNPNGIIEYSMGGIDRIGHYSSINDTGWIVFSTVNFEVLKEPNNKNIVTIVIFIIFILIITIISYTFIINYFSKPIYKLLGVIRKIKQGDYRDRFIYDKDNEFGEIAKAFNDLIDNIEKNKKYIEAKNRDLKSITSNIPGGVHRSRIENEELYFDFLSAGYLNILGYEKHEFKEIFNKKVIDLIYENDRERVLDEVREQLSKSNKYNIEYRIMRKDESIIWLLDNGQIIKNRDGKVFSYNVAINITESKLIQEELKHSEERYSIIMSQTEDIIFEWDIIKDVINFSENWQKKFGSMLVMGYVSKKIYETNIIYKEDIKNFGKLLNSIVNGNAYEEAEIRLRKTNGEYIWCKIRITAMFDENGNIFKAVGAIIDINKEKIEGENLLFKAQRDSLTELFNKGNTQIMIEEYMESEGINSNSALFVIDVDNFKAINDNLGHLAGDAVLKSISSMLAEVFSVNSIIGRIGGDEFVVFLKDISSEDLLYEKAEELVDGFRRNIVEGTKDYKVSGSIGIAKYPEHGRSFEELFENADKAVYFAKKKGKDNYCLFKYA